MNTGVIATAEYIDRQAVLDAIWPVDPENDGSDGGTVVLKNCIFSSEEIEALVSDIPALGQCSGCANWRGEPGDEYAPCSDCDGVMETDNFCKNFEPREDNGNG